jgi:hypothetical protein
MLEPIALTTSSPHAAGCAGLHLLEPNRGRAGKEERRGLPLSLLFLLGPVTGGDWSNVRELSGRARIDESGGLEWDL